MKYIALIFLAVLLIQPIVYAQTKTNSIATGSATKSITPTDTPVPTSAIKEVEELKDKLATKVASMRKDNQKAISGIITTTGEKSLSMETAEGAKYTAKLDDVITKYFVINGTVKKDAKLTDLKKGDYIIVAGPYTDSTVTANAIYRDQQYMVGSGKITAVDKTAFTLSVVTEDKENLTIDVESSTKRLLVDSKTLDKETVGFTKIKEGDTVHYVLTKTGQEKEKNRYSALRIVIIPQEYFVSK